MDFLKNIRTFSVKNFIADLPAALNQSFEAIKKTFASFYDSEKNTINADSMNVTGTMTSNSVVTNFLTVRGENGSKINISEMNRAIQDIYENLNNIYTLTGIQKPANFKKNRK